MNSEGMEIFMGLYAQLENKLLMIIKSYKGKNWHLRNFSYNKFKNMFSVICFSDESETDYTMHIPKKMVEFFDINIYKYFSKENKEKVVKNKIDNENLKQFHILFDGIACKLEKILKIKTSLSSEYDRFEYDSENEEYIVIFREDSIFGKYTDSLHVEKDWLIKTNEELEDLYKEKYEEERLEKIAEKIEKDFMSDNKEEIELYKELHQKYRNFIELN